MKRTFCRPLFGSLVTGTFGFFTQRSQAERISQGRAILVLNPKLLISSIMRRNHRLHNGLGILSVWRGWSQKTCKPVLGCVWHVPFSLIFKFQQSSTHFWNCGYPKLANPNQCTKQPFLPVPNAYFAEFCNLGSRVYIEQILTSAKFCCDPEGSRAKWDEESGNAYCP